MSDEKTAQKAPEVGTGSPKGMRWFVSKFYELSMTMKPQGFIRDEGGRDIPQKAERIAFIKQVKPARFQGEGTLGSANTTGSDKNDPPFWGIFAIEDPGPDNDKLSKSQKRAREIIDFLRAHEFYKTSTQNNQPDSKANLKELNWDPRTMEAGAGHGVIRRGPATESPDSPAPDEGRPGAPKARVANMT